MIVVLGIIFSSIIWGISNSFTNNLKISDQLKREARINLSDKLIFSYKFFFAFILPLIVFPSGFNMRRKKFFRNIGTISKFGLFATLICFAVMSLLVFIVSRMHWLSYYYKGEKIIVDLSM